jgi:glycosidase
VLQDLSLYHPYGEVLKWEPPYQVLGELPGGLDDLRTEDPRVLAIMIDIWSWWMEQTDCDGFRVDTVKHVDMPFWYAWLQAMRRHAQALGRRDFFIFGEVFSAEDSICAPYTRSSTDGRRGFDAVFNFSLAEGLRDALGRDGSLRLLRASLVNRPLYDSTALPFMLNFVDNHDVDRFLALPRADSTRLLQALTFMYGMQGLPLLYYGTEQAFPGGTGHDWKNRESMFAGGWKGDAPPGDSYDTTGTVFRHIAALQRLRQEYPLLRHGDARLHRADTARSLLVVERTLGKQRAYVMINSGFLPLDVRLQVDQDLRPWPDASTLRDGPLLRIILPPASVRLLLPENPRPAFREAGT